VGRLEGIQRLAEQPVAATALELESNRLVHQLHRSQDKVIGVDVVAKPA